MATTIRLPMDDGSIAEVPAKIIGPLAVHKNPDRAFHMPPHPDATWTLSHVATGGKIKTFRTRRGALKALEAIAPIVDWTKVTDFHSIPHDARPVIRDALADCDDRKAVYPWGR